MDPIGLYFRRVPFGDKTSSRFCFRRVPPGDKTFSRSQKGCLKVKVSKPFLKNNKMEIISNGPNWVLLSLSPFGG